MQLYLMRHAHAVDGFPDEERSLSRKGLRIVDKWVHTLPDMSLIKPKQIWTSPYRRAYETSLPLAGALGLEGKLRIREDLIPSSDPSILSEELHSLEKSLLIVGHNPHVSLLAGLLVNSEMTPSFLHFKKAGILVLNRDKATQRFRQSAYLTPESLGWL